MKLLAEAVINRMEYERARTYCKHVKVYITEENLKNFKSCLLLLLYEKTGIRLGHLDQVEAHYAICPTYPKFSIFCSSGAYNYIEYGLGGPTNGAQIVDACLSYKEAETRWLRTKRVWKACTRTVLRAVL